MKLTKESYDYILKRIEQLEFIKGERRNSQEYRMIIYELDICKRYKKYFEELGEMEIKDDKQD